MIDSAAPDLNPRALQPRLAELLRTCVHPLSLVLKVEHVWPTELVEQFHPRDLLDNSREDDIDTEDEAAKPSRPHCLKLALSDGQLQIQALLATKLHTKELLELRRGDLVEIKKFQVKSAPRVNGRGKVIYLGVEACEWIGTTVTVDEDLAGGFIPEDLAEHESEGQEAERERSAQLPSSPSLIRPGCLLSRASDEKEEAASGDGPPFLPEAVDLAEASLTPNMNRKRARASTPDDPAKSKRRIAGQGMASKSISSRSTSVRFSTPKKEASDSEDEFETVFVSQSTIQRRREVLRDVSQNTPGKQGTPKRFQLFDGKGGSDDIQTAGPPSPEQVVDKEEERPATPRIEISDRQQATEPSPSSGIISTPGPHQNHHDQTHPFQATAPTDAPLHTLSSLLNPHLPRRNYTCTILAVITWVSGSLIRKPNSPFPAKRHIKIQDASMTAARPAGITLAVFVDAQHFTPAVGTVALFRGVTMQRWEGEVILNAYAHLGERERPPWFVHDEATLCELGHDARPLRRWWAERKGGASAR